MHWQKRASNQYFKNQLKLNLMKNIYSVFALIILLIASGCGNNSEKSNNAKSTNTQVEETINGTYTYSDNSVELEITISEDSWYGKTMIVTGFGSEYDSQNAQYDNGTVNGNDLYDNSGMVKIGYVSGKSLTISIGGQRVTLRKK
ncbi:MAG: hypothetical protein H8E60_06960 [Candidatus Marinimicrobia bacterium]|nr:hypothetical protein [Candidatus Neomarinimicrobiota bacterium]